jgi:hypothetical protein
MMTTWARVLRVDLLTRHWRSYLLVCVIALIVHAAWLGVFGIRSPTDFRVRYDPAARQLLAAVGVDQFADTPPREIGTYAWSRIGYISFVAGAYLVWGVSLGAVVYSQIALAWLVYPLIFHLLLHMTARHALALWASLAWLSYADGYQWHFWALPDALYRLVFVASFFVLLRLWEEQRHTAFLVVGGAALLLNTALRIETPLYALPLIGLCAYRLWRQQPAVGWALVLIGAVVGWLARHQLGDLWHQFMLLQTQGFVLPGSGTEIEGLTYLVPPANPSTAEWLAYLAHLFVLRFWYAITPLPELWSNAHRLYYFAYVMPCYLLIAMALWSGTGWKRPAFLACFWMFAAGIILQTIVSVDPSMRYAYTSQAFLFLCAAMSWPDARALVSRWFRSTPAAA